MKALKARPLSAELYLRDFLPSKRAHAKPEHFCCLRFSQQERFSLTHHSTSLSHVSIGLNFSHVPFEPTSTATSCVGWSQSPRGQPCQLSKYSQFLHKRVGCSLMPLPRHAVTVFVVFRVVAKVKVWNPYWLSVAILRLD